MIKHRSITTMICLVIALSFLKMTAVLAMVQAGTGKCNLTPPIGTPSAGHTKRSAVMQGIHDPLWATAIVIDNGEKLMAFCSVDNLGFTHEMTREILQRVQRNPALSSCEIFAGSTHTHSGGGAFLNIPVIGEKLAGKYDPQIMQFYIDSTVKAIEDAFNNLQPAMIGIGYGHAADLSIYRGQWPKDVKPLTDVAVIKIIKPDGSPLAVLYNYPLHPTVLGQENLLFSSDFIGFARDRIKSLIGEEVESVYFNGAQGDIIPNLPKGGDRFAYCSQLGESLAETVFDIWSSTETDNSIEIATFKDSYSFAPATTSQGLKLPIEKYDSEINLIVLNNTHAFITIPGELSCIYDANFKNKGLQSGFSHVSILGLVNDAHGYIIQPDSWRHQTYESTLSFGGEHYGSLIEEKVNRLFEEFVCKESGIRSQE